ncbi:MAG: hypothetical protein IPK06_04510 [Ignavibacteriae bacterium]|nr:hypothetical protein [Ignavibacteriota bacterium]
MSKHITYHAAYPSTLNKYFAANNIRYPIYAISSAINNRMSIELDLNNLSLLVHTQFQIFQV